MTDRFDADTTDFFNYFNIVMDRNGFAILPSTPEERRRVHVNKNKGVPFAPLCDSADVNPHFIVHMHQIDEHPRICLDCLNHPDLPLLVLADT